MEWLWKPHTLFSEQRLLLSFFAEPRWLVKQYINPPLLNSLTTQCQRIALGRSFFPRLTQAQPAHVVWIHAKWAAIHLALPFIPPRKVMHIKLAAIRLTNTTIHLSCPSMELITTRRSQPTVIRWVRWVAFMRREQIEQSLPKLKSSVKKDDPCSTQLVTLSSVIF